MIRFLDGPAAGEILALKRAPRFLRAVRAIGCDWDGLDQRSDRPEADEAITVYERVGEAGALHLNAGRKGCGWFASAEYRVVDPQPPDATLRDQVLFEHWAHEIVRERAEAVAS